jgi:hypothetical protein
MSKMTMPVLADAGLKDAVVIPLDAGQVIDRE